MMRKSEIESWVADIAGHTKPGAIHWCDGSDAEAEELTKRMLSSRTLERLDQARYPRSFLHRSHPSDVARTENLTFICSKKKEDAGPTNNWMSPEEAGRAVWPLFAGAMATRTLYVVPYLMGPVGSKYSRVGVELTDSPYVALNLRTMTRMGNVALRELAGMQRFVRGIHSLGDLSPDRRFVLHFPETRTIWSIGSGYGGNALLSKKCHALRIASVEARDEGWLAEHMMIVGVTSPAGEKHYIAAAFPSACGKTNLAMLVPKRPGWQVETVGDDICWMHIGDDGRLWAINPEAGFFGVAPGTSTKTNPNAIAALEHDVIFTNVAMRANRAPWWEGLDPLRQDEILTDWRGKQWMPRAEEPAAHPNARFTVAAKQCPSVGPSIDDPRGVPISAILFGGRRARLTPLVYEARDWAHGVYMGATLVSETTAAATGATGVPRNDPMAMLPFCGYNMADYFGHWLSMGRRLVAPPKIFHVNWFRQNDGGGFLWPGFGDNIRVLSWIIDRIAGRAPRHTTPIGNVPTRSAFDLDALDLPDASFDALTTIDAQSWLAELEQSDEFIHKFGDRFPVPLRREHDALRDRLRASIS
ncbi:MAG TPA: phosphoenolpyruvate carboxykinase (GTP) [Labilithrix sp.]|nr:phosphoenolpyruvate carboxykinase (GTP) [Labilithrix sp.]